MKPLFVSSYWGFNLDAKNRVAVPAEYREAMKDACGADEFVLAVSPYGCLTGHPIGAWPEVVQMTRAWIRKNPHGVNFRRFFLATAQHVKPDKHGRFVISGPLRKHLRLAGKVHWIGDENRFELWDGQAWEQMYGSIDFDEIKQDFDQVVMASPALSRQDEPEREPMGW